MKLSALIALVATVILTGCASSVTTFDSHGRMIGSCKAQTGFIIAGGAGCSGSANQEGRDR
ncbi:MULTISPECIES: hypothetical protein [Acinetobacter]|jgi:uncharacterized lipoprotein YajG|uniref:Lipoprotein YajG n=1 Tax=Acinetobacter lwoffii TaxID=28090 RepID=A0AAJ4P5U0_ACILW|nr:MULTISPECIES: hypothetical protein [Pseudomonadota]ODN55830.1 hypothetical protein A9Z54_16240 [Acinetobacter sp. 51m]MCO8085170.1 YgdI/YgdR family lipoprotein [Acinetobacter lwoffii]MCO8094442.1 YgdI/YgdR family lipoprotein [Acinetobacter lwoffii]MCU4420140.1 YgdI/YgdR family lipoprotein [Acinetobacter lwoffii]MCU4438375.1 YgdI/YgdR family lipoprotein [Acinetobacter lwoffii]